MLLHSNYINLLECVCSKSVSCVTTYISLSCMINSKKSTNVWGSGARGDLWSGKGFGSVEQNCVCGAGKGIGLSFQCSMSMARFGESGEAVERWCVRSGKRL